MLELYCIVLPLHFPTSFTLHNIPIVYKIFSISELHLLMLISTTTYIYLVQKEQMLEWIQKCLKIANDVGATVPIKFQGC